MLKNACHLFVVMYMRNGKKVEKLVTGGAIYIGRGCFVSASHLFNRDRLEDCLIKVKPWNGVYVDVSLGYDVPGVDFAILRLKSLKECIRLQGKERAAKLKQVVTESEQFSIIDVPRDRTYNVGETVYAIHHGNEPGFIFTYSKGVIGYPYMGHKVAVGAAGGKVAVGAAGGKVAVGAAEGKVAVLAAGGKVVVEDSDSEEDSEEEDSEEEEVDESCPLVVEKLASAFPNQPFYRTFGAISQSTKWEIKGQTPLIQLTGIAISQGASGCPIFKTGTNEFVGLIVGFFSVYVLVVASDLISAQLQTVEGKIKSDWDFILHSKSSSSKEEEGADAGLREKLAKITASEYFTAAPVIKAPVEVAGSDTCFQMPVIGSIISPVSVPDPVENSALEFQQEEVEHPSSPENKKHGDETGDVEVHQEGKHSTTSL